MATILLLSTADTDLLAARAGERRLPDRPTPPGSTPRAEPEALAEADRRGWISSSAACSAAARPGRRGSPHVRATGPADWSPLGGEAAPGRRAGGARRTVPAGRRRRRARLPASPGGPANLEGAGACYLSDTLLLTGQGLAPPPEPRTRAAAYARADLGRPWPVRPSQTGGTPPGRRAGRPPPRAMHPLTSRPTVVGDRVLPGARAGRQHRDSSARPRGRRSPSAGGTPLPVYCSSAAIGRPWPGRPAPPGRARSSPPSSRLAARPPPARAPKVTGTRARSPGWASRSSRACA